MRPIERIVMKERIKKFVNEEGKILFVYTTGFVAGIVATAVICKIKMIGMQIDSGGMMDEDNTVFGIMLKNGQMHTFKKPVD